jgi:hypothetical protein
MNTRKPGASRAEVPNYGESLIRESGEGSFRDSGARTCSNPRESKGRLGNLRET